MLMQRNELNFSGQNIYVGIDVHLKSWSVTILTEYLHHHLYSYFRFLSIFCESAGLGPFVATLELRV